MSVNKIIKICDICGKEYVTCLKNNRYFHFNVCEDSFCIKKWEEILNSEIEDEL